MPNIRAIYIYPGYDDARPNNGTFPIVLLVFHKIMGEVTNWEQDVFEQSVNIWLLAISPISKPYKVSRQKSEPKEPHRMSITLMLSLIAA